MKLCPKCLKEFKRSPQGKSQRKIDGAWGKGKWPSNLYHNSETRLCPKHRVQSSTNSAARRAKKLHATPEWADKNSIKAVYSRRIQEQEATGVKQHVDHIIPLRGKNVSGLHVPENLRVIPAAENITKSNKHKEST